jgi:hypothetical protein
MCRKPSDCPFAGMHSGGEWLVMMALLASDPRLLSRAELQRELASSKEGPPSIEDEIENLHAVGLLNVSGELVGASRAARYMDELLGRPI